MLKTLVTIAAGFFLLIWLIMGLLFALVIFADYQDQNNKNHE